MKLINRSSILGLVVMAFLIPNLGAVRPPAYLKELNIEVKPVSEQEIDNAYAQLNKKTLIVLRSLKDGGFVCAVNEDGEKIASTTQKSGDAYFLRFTDKTPQETNFYAIKITKRPQTIQLTSLEMKGLSLASMQGSTEVTFKKSNKNDKTQQWAIESADGINQIYFKNVSTKTYLGVNSVGTLVCQAKEATRSELFKVVILD